ncbi:hypothetical protein HK096_002433 [Nowakowskiella sp. JEL0078]|nr:hypothetical protein HK096_002433 [Nowakowskiella sp. JEL0078]
MILVCKLDCWVFKADVKPCESIFTLKERIKDGNRDDFEPFDAEKLILVRVFETGKNIGIPNSSKTKDLIESLVDYVRSVDLPEQTDYEDKLPGFEWSNDNVSAKVLNAAYKLRSYSLKKDTEEEMVDIIIILPLEENRIDSLKRSAPAGVFSISSDVESKKKKFILDEEVTKTVLATDTIALNDPLLLKREKVVKLLKDALNRHSVIRLTSPPASGKSSIIRLLCSDLEKNGEKTCVIVSCVSFQSWLNAERVRTIEITDYVERSALGFILDQVGVRSWYELTKQVDYLFLDDAQFISNKKGNVIFAEFENRLGLDSMKVALFTSFCKENVLDSDMSALIWFEKFGYSSLKLEEAEVDELERKLLQQPKYEDHAEWFKLIYKILRREANGHVGLLRIWSQQMLDHYFTMKMIPNYSEALQFYYGELTTALICKRIFQSPTFMLSEVEEELLKATLRGEQIEIPTLADEEKIEMELTKKYLRLKEQQQAARRLMRHFILTNDDKMKHLQFATLLHERHFSRLAFPTRLTRLPDKLKDVDNWLLLVIQTFEAEKFKPESFNAKQFPKKCPIQHEFWKGASFCLPPNNQVSAEVSKIYSKREREVIKQQEAEAEAKGKGKAVVDAKEIKNQEELDFWINGDLQWAIELLVCGSEKGDHVRRMKENYSILNPKQSRVVDFRPVTMPTRGEHEDIYVMVMVEEAFRGAWVVKSDKYVYVKFTGKRPTDDICEIPEWIIGKWKNSMEGEGTRKK